MSKKKKDNWKVPSNASDFFDPHYNDKFKKEHPILYWLTIIGIIVLACSGPVVYVSLISDIMPSDQTFIEKILFIIGFISSFGISIGLCNIFLALYKQYLGHLLTIISFGIGVIGCGLSLLVLWLL